jgi:hypothetical protein
LYRKNTPRPQFVQILAYLLRQINTKDTCSYIMPVLVPFRSQAASISSPFTSSLMNISHRSLWNSALGAWVAVSEATRGRGKRSGGGSAVLAGAVLLLMGSVPTLGFAQSTWNKTTASAWATAGNWTGGLPGANTAVTVSQGTAQITANTAIGSLAGTAGGTITVSTGKSLTTGGNGTRPPMAVSSAARVA